MLQLSLDLPLKFLLLPNLGFDASNGFVALVCRWRVRRTTVSARRCYLRDPDGNGVELYDDRPRDQWPCLSDGQLAMTNDPLDLDDLLGELT